MPANQTHIVEQFYAALNAKDLLTLRSLYHPKAEYNDEIFSLNYKEILALWYSSMQPEMELVAEVHSIDQQKESIVTHWTISYTIASINKRITLDEVGRFEFQDGLIIRHTDEYSFYRWCAQAFGVAGMLASWSKWLRKKVRNQAYSSINANIYAANSME